MLPSKESASLYVGGKLKLAPVEKDWPLIGGLSLLGGALLCFALLDVMDSAAVLAGALAVPLLYCVISALWEPGAREPASSFGVSGRGLRAFIITLGAVLLIFSFLGAVRTEPGSGPLLSIGWNGLPLGLGALGVFLLSASTWPVRRAGGHSTAGLDGSVPILAGSLLAYLVLSAGSSSVMLLSARDWFLLVAFASGLVFTVTRAFRDRRSEASV